MGMYLNVCMSMLSSDKLEGISQSIVVALECLTIFRAKSNVLDVVPHL